jgi:hypothetical protein
MMRGTVRPVPSAFNGPFHLGKVGCGGKPALDTLARSCRSSSGRARRIWPGRLLAWPYACQIRLYLCDRARGAIRSQVNDGPVTTYKAGESFSELPGDRHGVSANGPVIGAAEPSSASRCVDITQQSAHHAMS